MAWWGCRMTDFLHAAYERPERWLGGGVRNRGTYISDRLLTRRLWKTGRWLGGGVEWQTSYTLPMKDRNDGLVGVSEIEVPIFLTDYLHAAYERPEWWLCGGVEVLRITAGRGGYVVIFIGDHLRQKAGNCVEECLPDLKMISIQKQGELSPQI